jgi:hypothetical protein
MVYETRYQVIAIDRDDGERLVYALSPDGRIVPLHARRDEGTAAGNPLAFDVTRRSRREALNPQFNEALPLAA